MDGKTLKERLIALTGLQLKEIAEKLEMSPQHLNQVLNAADIKTGFVEKVSEVFILSLDDLYSTSNTVTGNNNIVGNINNMDAVIRALDEIAAQRRMVEKSQEQIDRLITMLENRK